MITMFPSTMFYGMQNYDYHRKTFLVLQYFVINLYESTFVVLHFSYNLCRDGLQESNVVTKTFTVDDVGPPPDDIDLDEIDLTPDFDSSYRPPSRSKRPSSASRKKVISYMTVNFVFCSLLCCSG